MSHGVDVVVDRVDPHCVSTRDGSGNLWPNDFVQPMAHGRGCGFSLRLAKEL